MKKTCATPKPLRIKGLQQMYSDYGGILQQLSTSTSNKKEILFDLDLFVVVNFEGTMYPGLITDKMSNKFKVSVIEKNIKTFPANPTKFGTQRKRTSILSHLPDF